MGVKKKRFSVGNVILITIIIVISVNALNEKIIIDLNEEVSRNGKNIIFIGASQDNANFDIDGELGTVKKGETKTIGGVMVHLIGLSTQPTRAIINITIDFVCGNGNCDSSLGEDTTSCCNDCGCLSAKDSCSDNRCIKNITIEEPVATCSTDEDCKQKGTICTKYTCDTATSKCTEEQIITCTDYDNCCPSQCTKQNDADCKGLDGCNSPPDCDDDNPCTDDFCTGNPKKCSHQTGEGCPEGNICLGIGERKDFYYCEMPGEWRYLKVKGTACNEDYECLTKNCKKQRCSGGGFGNVYIYGLIGFILVLVCTIGSYMYVSINKNREG